MAETKIFTFSMTEYVEMCIKQLGIHEGLWGPYLEFGFGVANVPVMPDSKFFQPAVINVVQKFGIQRFDSPTMSFTVDAAKVNPDFPPPSPSPELIGHQ